ncbi:MAG: hypothetical protein KAW56_11545 [Candidatus Marinimicrobia bacterium]|nr:hypothetical protein [candidate division WOR-3 bacterium]MCK4447698.1 hypothetical protein [Candidatus Neomarinimicrobiota bacterium]
MNKKLHIIAVISNIIYLIFMIYFIVILVISFRIALVNVINQSEFMHPNLFRNITNYSIIIIVLLNSLVACTLLIQYNTFIKWLASQNKLLIEKIDNLIEMKNIDEDFLRHTMNKIKTNKISIYPWSIICILGPQLITIPMYLLHQNWRKVGTLENECLRRIKSSVKVENKIGLEKFPIKRFWLWAIFCNWILGYQTPIWIFIYLKKVRHFVSDVEDNLKELNNQIIG